jgi:hypothetical protein
MQDLLTLESVRRWTPARMWKDFKIDLQSHPVKGLGVVARQFIKEGEVLAYYKLEIFREEGYQSPTDFMYAFDVYTKSGNTSRTFLGDISLRTLDPPLWEESLQEYIPYWGIFLNEPSPGQQPNVHIDMNLEENYRHRKRVQAGEFMTYVVMATEDIQPGEEVLWYYGSKYERNYPVAEIIT